MDEDTNTITSRSNHNTKKNPSFHTERTTAATRGDGVGDERGGEGLPNWVVFFVAGEGFVVDVGVWTRERVRERLIVEIWLGSRGDKAASFFRFYRVGVRNFET